MHLMDGRNVEGQRWDADKRASISQVMSLDPDPVPSSVLSARAALAPSARLEPDVRDWHVGDRVFGFMDVSETNIITVDRPTDFIWPGFASPSPWLIWELGDLDPLLAGFVLRAGLRRDE